MPSRTTFIIDSSRIEGDTRASLNHTPSFLHTFFRLPIEDCYTFLCMARKFGSHHGPVPQSICRAYMYMILTVILHCQEYQAVIWFTYSPFASLYTTQRKLYYLLFYAAILPAEVMRYNVTIAHRLERITKVLMRLLASKVPISDGY